MVDLGHLHHTTRPRLLISRRSLTTPAHPNRRLHLSFAQALGSVRSALLRLFAPGPRRLTGVGVYSAGPTGPVFSIFPGPVFPETLFSRTFFLVPYLCVTTPVPFRLILFPPLFSSQPIPIHITRPSPTYPYVLAFLLDAFASKPHIFSFSLLRSPFSIF